MGDQELIQPTREVPVNIEDEMCESMQSSAPVGASGRSKTLLSQERF
jgi:hypothetical protein